MAKTQIFTQHQLETAKNALAELPDLRKDKITTPELLDSLKEQIVNLANSKGYSVAEIKSALEGIGVMVSVKAITDLIKTPQKRRVSNKTTNKPL